MDLKNKALPSRHFKSINLVPRCSTVCCRETTKMKCFLHPVYCSIKSYDHKMETPPRPPWCCWSLSDETVMLSDHQVAQTHHRTMLSTRCFTGTLSLLDDVTSFHFRLTSFRFPHNATCSVWLIELLFHVYEAIEPHRERHVVACARCTMKDLFRFIWYIFVKKKKKNLFLFRRNLIKYFSTLHCMFSLMLIHKCSMVLSFRQGNDKEYS